jgi:phosphoribosylaminoimidazole-succinocarboxamide synthase
MGIDIGLLREQCARTLERTDFRNLGERVEAKVRDNYIQAEQGRRLIVVSDRVSTFDVIVGTLPFKGQVLNELAAFWLEKSRSLAPNHLLEVPDPNVSVVRECRVLPVEFVFRAYLTGSSNTSIWRAYEDGSRDYCGHRLPDGMKKHERLPEPLLTPTTKAELGEHDELSSREELIASGAISEELYDGAAAIGRRIFDAGVDWAAQHGLILVDTKYEMGLSPDGELMLVDEVHTPDSSRYWWRHSYDRAMSEGRDPEALDKEYLRRWMVERGYRGQGDPPQIPDEVRCEASRRYIEAFEAVTGRAFEPSTDEPIERIERNLAQFFRPKA